MIRLDELPGWHPSLATVHEASIVASLIDRQIGNYFQRHHDEQRDAWIMLLLTTGPLKPAAAVHYLEHHRNGLSNNGRLTVTRL